MKLYVADISNLPEPLSCPEVLQKLPMERQQKIYNSKQEKSRRQSMGVGLLLQKVLALYHMQDSDVFVDEHGKPKVERLEFSLSHSGNLVLCAVSEEPVGCDVEEIRKAPERVAERYFSCGEQEYLSQFAEEEYDRAFFRLWTMKESYVKMTGEGMGLPFSVYELLVDACASLGYESSARVLRNGEVQDCYISEISLQGYIISICAESSAHMEVIWENSLFISTHHLDNVR